MAGGAAVTVVTKSGTNQFKGAAFEFYNGDKLNATPYYFGSPSKPPKLPLKQNNYGGTLGGRSSRDKVFFFGSFEGYKRDAEPARRSSACPTPRSAPATSAGRPTTAARSRSSTTRRPVTRPAPGAPPFAATRSPLSMINPIALKIMNLFPLPNTGGIGARRPDQQLHARREPRTVDRENYDFKVNWNRTSAHQIWGKFSYMDAVVDDLTNYLGPDPNADGRRRRHQGLPGRRPARRGRSGRPC